MSGSGWRQHLPNLTTNNHAVTSPATMSYNCIAWAANDVSNWWWPAQDAYWPPGAPREMSLHAFEKAYASYGYKPCADGTLEKDTEKIAIYAVDTGNGVRPAHAAKQLENGNWSSKLGPHEDIEHLLPEDVECSTYGRVVAYMSRPRRRV